MTSRTARPTRPPVAALLGVALLLLAGVLTVLVAPTAQATQARVAGVSTQQPPGGGRQDRSRDRGRDRDRDSSPVRQLARPLVVGHRGAPGYRPEHTLASYRLAIAQGADYVEPDLVSTKDHVLVARHENDITATTDVADRPAFADRRTTKVIDGVRHTGWFTEDFTLAELRRLRAVERLPGVRPANTRYDGRFTVPTFAEVLDLVRSEERRLRRDIGVAPETKHPSYFDSLGLSLEEPMLAELRRHGLDRRNADVLIQSFEVSNLRELHTMTRLPLEQLVSGSGAPWDQRRAGTGVTYASMTTPAGLRTLRRYAEWLGAEKSLVVPTGPDGFRRPATRLVGDAHRAGLRVVAYTVRDENRFMPRDYRRGVDPDAPGDVRAEVLALLDAGIDAFFADHPDSGVDARDDWVWGGS